MDIVITELTGIVLKTKNKVCEEDIIVTLDESVKYKGEPGYSVYVRGAVGTSTSTTTLKSNITINVNGSGNLLITKSLIPSEYNQGNTDYMLYGVKNITIHGVSTYYTKISFKSKYTGDSIDELPVTWISPNGTAQTFTIPYNGILMIISHETDNTHSGGGDA